MQSFLLALTATFLGGDVVTVAGTGASPSSPDGQATTVAIGGPFGVAVGPDGALFVCETQGHVIRRIDLKSGQARTVAGSGKRGYSGDGGPASKASLNEPYEVRFDSEGHMYFVEMKNNLVRKVDAKTGIISTVAGTGKQGFSGDGGPATKATFNPCATASWLWLLQAKAKALSASVVMNPPWHMSWPWV